MAKICYAPRRFTDKLMVTINRANQILEDYGRQGFTLTLRQLYYQFVARGFIPNNQKEYKKLGDAIGNARLAGFIDWSYLEDRTRNLSHLLKYEDIDDALHQLHQVYHIDLWKDQEYRPEVWIEKDALVGVIQGVCEENDIPFFSCRGYTSLSEMFGAASRLRDHSMNGQIPYILHFGDHDPSGIDMSRDIHDRLADTFYADHEFCRVALTMDQIHEFNPPPNPAKVKDSRFKSYRKLYGDESWELDALNPSSFRDLIEDRIGSLKNKKLFDAQVDLRRKQRHELMELAEIRTAIPALKKDSERLPKVLKELHALKEKKRKKK